MFLTLTSHYINFIVEIDYATSLNNKLNDQDYINIY